MGFTIKILNNKETKQIRSSKIVLLDLLDQKEEKKYYAARVNNRLRALTYDIHFDAGVEFLDLTDSDAVAVYERCLRYLFCMAAKELYPNWKFKISYSVSRSILVQSLDEITIDSEMVDKINKQMQDIVDQDYEFEKIIVPNEKAIEIYKKYGYEDKIEILAYRPESTVHFYRCNKYMNYMYGMMVPSTGYLRNYNILLHSLGIILQYPRSEEKGQIPEFVDAPVYASTLTRQYRWDKLVGAGSVAGVNKLVKEYGSTAFINMCECRHNRQLTEIGQAVEDNISNVKIVCIAGPSSSGKTTFANRLRVELLSRGIKSIRISIDDYYKPRSEVPVGEDGKPDFESIHALNIERFNSDLLGLIQGKKVTLPHFDFKANKVEDGPTYQLEQDEPIIIEGIHALNPLLTSSIDKKQKYCIYIAPQSQIYLDNQNPMSLTDLRLLRRIVRDYQFRNSSPEETISMWPGVRRGEFLWIYDTQENANYVFNSFLPYELCIMKKYAVPLLQGIPADSIYFPDGERLLRLLKYFVDIDETQVPNNSLMREFIGGSVYQDDD